MRAIGIAILLTIGILSWHANAGAEPLSHPAKASIAILPIQNEADPTYTLSANPTSDVVRFLDRINQHVGKRPKDRQSRSTQAIREGLVFHLGRGLARLGYRVFMGKTYEDFYRELEIRGREISYKELQSYVPADAFLLVHIEEWESKDFDNEGKLLLSYSVHLIDPKREGKGVIIWSAKARKTVELEPNDFLFKKRQEEMVREVARMLLKGCPKAGS